MYVYIYIYIDIQNGYHTCRQNGEAVVGATAQHIDDISDAFYNAEALGGTRHDVTSCHQVHHL